MSRRAKSKETRRDWRWYASFALNGAVALSMVLGTVFLFTGAPTRSAVPTIAVPTISPATPVAPAPTVAPTSVPPSPTPKASTQNYKFAVAGDSRDGDVIFSQLLKQVSADGSTFLIHLGDLVSTGKPDEWVRWRALMQDFKLPFYPVPGNHDTNSATLNDYLRATGAPAVHYTLDRGAAHFVFLDSHTGILTDAELQYLDRDLAATRAPIKIIVTHYPPFDPAGGNHILGSGKDRLMQIAQARGANYVFAGHIHCYAQAERNGVQYIISGGAGAPITCLPVAGGFYHYLSVIVQGETITTETIHIE